MRTATFTRMGQGTRKLWVLRVEGGEGGEAPKPGERLEVLKKDGTSEEKVVLKCVWEGRTGDREKSPHELHELYLCTFLGKRDARMLELARGLREELGVRTPGNVTALEVDTYELAGLVLEKLTPRDRAEKDDAT